MQLLLSRGGAYLRHRRYAIKTHNAISPVGLEVFPPQLYSISPD